MPPDGIEDTIEVNSVEVPEGTADLFDVGPVDISPPVPEPEPEPSPPTPEPVPDPAVETGVPPTPPTSSLPDWLSSDKDERRIQLEAALQALPPEERNSLSPVQEALQATQTYTASETRQRTIAELARTQSAESLETTRSEILNNVAAWLPTESGINLQAETNRLIESAQSDYHQSLAQDVQTGIAGALNGLGVTQLPPQLLQAVEQAQSFGGVVNTYLNFAAQVGYQAGMGKGGMDANKRTDADRIADKVRLTNEIKAQLVKDGWREPIAPNISGGVSALPDSDIGDAELKSIMALGDADYDSVMNGPKGEQLRKLFADAMSNSV